MELPVGYDPYDGCRNGCDTLQQNDPMLGPEMKLTIFGGLEMGTNTKTGGCLHKGKMILDAGVG
eukprot:2964684-Pyramimonas_sp.AAC.1